MYLIFPFHICYLVSPFSRYDNEFGNFDIKFRVFAHQHVFIITIYSLENIQRIKFIEIALPLFCPPSVCKFGTVLWHPPFLQRYKTKVY